MKTYLTIMTVALLALAAGSAHASPIFTNTYEGSGCLIWTNVDSVDYFDGARWDGTNVIPGPGLDTGPLLVSVSPLITANGSSATATNTANLYATSIYSKGTLDLHSGPTDVDPNDQYYVGASGMVNTEVWFKLSEGSNVLLTGSLFDADFSFNYSGPGGIVGNNILSYSSGNVGPGVGIGWSNFLAAGDYYIAAFIEDGTDPDYPDSHGSYEFKLEIVPEPISMVMLGCLGAGMAVARKLRRKKA